MAPNSLLCGVAIRNWAAAILMALMFVGCGGLTSKASPRAESSETRSTQSLEANVTALVAAHDAWIAAINRGEIQRGLDGMTEDAVIVGTEGPVAHGSAEIRDRVAQLTSVPGLNIQFTLTKASVSPDNRVGFVIGDSAISAPGRDGKLHTTKQRLLTVWRKDTDQKWRCYLDVTMRPTPASGTQE